MQIRLLPVIVLGLVVTAAYSQDAGIVQQAPDSDAGQGQSVGRGWRGGMMGAGRGVMGTVTETSAEHYTIKTDTGESCTVHYSANTHILKQMIRRRGERGNPPQMLKPSEIKVGDIIAANGEVDTAAKSVGAVFIVQIDPERAKQIRAMEANFGKTWLMGKVTAVDGVKVTLESPIDKASHAFVADEGTTFRKRREPITLADVQAGDMVRVEGSVKDGAFLATSVAVMVMPQGGRPTMPRGNPPQ